MFPPMVVPNKIIVAFGIAVLSAAINIFSMAIPWKLGVIIFAPIFIMAMCYVAFILSTEG